MSAIRVIGTGNSFVGDDGAGILAARRLRELLGDRADVIEAELGGLDVLDLMEGAQVAIVIDAARSGRPAGTIHRFDASSSPISQATFPHSTHALNAVDALELGRALGRLPPQVIVYGIEAAQVTAGTAMSPAVVEAVEIVATRVVQDVEALAHA